MADIYLAKEILNPEAAALLTPLLSLPGEFTLIFSPLGDWPGAVKESDALVLVLAGHGAWLLSFQPILQPQAVPLTFRRAEDLVIEEAVGRLQRKRQEIETTLGEMHLDLPVAIREVLVMSARQPAFARPSVEVVPLVELLATLQARPTTRAILSASLREKVAAGLQGRPGATRINQYQLIVRLRAGIPPIPHLAYDSILDRPVQLEEYPYDSLSLPGQKEFVQHEIIREAKLTMQLHHENINRVEQIISQEERLWVVTEWIPQSLTLREWLRLQASRAAATGALGRAVAPDTARGIVIDLCKALEYAHNKGIVHRHVRPENVLILPNYRAKLTNFGLAKKADMGTRPTYDLRQMIKENPYAAPEFHLGKEGHHQVDGRVDIYAVGVIFYELLTGLLPGHLDERFWEPPSQLNPSLGPEYDTIIAKALRFDPDQRYSAIGTLHRLLEQRPEAVLSEQTRLRYSERRLIRRTRNSLIFAAYDVNCSRTVTLKKVLLAPQLTAARRLEALQALQTEARLASQLVHPNIVAIFDYFSEDDDAYIVMEMVEGPTLREVLEGEGPLDLPILLDILDQLLDALRYAHRQGIVHGDIKPENIVYHEGEVTLLDFGLADFVPGISTGMEDQKTGGTARYMAPEQLQGYQDVDARADIFALGVLMYELLTKHYPYRPDVILSRFMGETVTQPVPPSEINLNIPVAIDQVVLQALEIDPGDRFQSVEEIQDALANLGNEQAGYAASRRRAASTVRWVELLGFLAVGLVMVTAVVLVYGHWLAPRPVKRSQRIWVASVRPTTAGRANPAAIKSASASASPTPGPQVVESAGPPSWAGRAVVVDDVAIQVTRVQPLPEIHSTSVVLRIANRSQQPVSFLNRNDRPDLITLTDNLGNDYSNLVDIKSVSPELLLIHPNRTVTGSFQLKDTLDPAATALTMVLKEYGEQGRQFPLALFKIEVDARTPAPMAGEGR